ncbi:hypothetical protein MMYC01_200405 [Madurella mycetomatis]|uniref:Uncharacterized protein n=1 Tax=Madurella mycetomatis TaxID=100816 RepID=A0A175WGK7_9PEZI|nr:hypothetical protein MMYC01_200405 [Madurella mycetomatis]
MAQLHSPPSIQLVQKSDFAKQLIIPLSGSSAQTTKLASPNHALIRTRLVALTTNNLTYARRGGLPHLAWWSVWAMPPRAALPPPFDGDEAELARHCRVPGWGCVEVLASTVPGLGVGATLFGYVPVGTRAEVVELARGEVQGHWLRLDPLPGGEGLNSVYKRYVQVPGGEEGGPGVDWVGLGWDAVMRVLFETGFLLNRFVFSWEGEERVVHPLGAKERRWTPEDADIVGRVVVLLAPSGKTGLAFAHELRFGRPEGKRPAKVIAIGSARSREFSAGTGLFDDVLLYQDLDDASFDLAAKLGGHQQRIVLMDFGARGDAVDRWAEALKGNCERLQVLVIGADPLAQAQSETAKRIQDTTSGVEQVFAGSLRERAIEIVGAARYFEEQRATWAKFKANGAIPGLQLKWGKGLEEFSKGWDALVRGDCGPGIGLVYEV